MGGVEGRFTRSIPQTFVTRTPPSRNSNPPPPVRHSGAASAEPGIQRWEAGVYALGPDLKFADNFRHPNLWIPILAARSRNDARLVIHMSGYSNPLKSLHLKKIMCHFIHASPRPAIILPRVPSGNALPVRPVWREGTGSAGTGLTEPGPAAGTGSPKSCGG